MTPLGRALAGFFLLVMTWLVGFSILEDAPAVGWLLILVGLLRGGYGVAQFVWWWQSGDDRPPVGPLEADDDAS